MKGIKSMWDEWDYGVLKDFVSNDKGLLEQTKEKVSKSPYYVQTLVCGGPSQDHIAINILSKGVKLHWFEFLLNTSMNAKHVLTWIQGCIPKEVQIPAYFYGYEKTFWSTMAECKEFGIVVHFDDRWCTENKMIIQLYEKGTLQISKEFTSTGKNAMEILEWIQDEIQPPPLEDAPENGKIHFVIKLKI